VRKVSTRLAGFAMAALVAALVAAGASPAWADMATMEQMTEEKVLGQADAPVTMLAFESLSCPHCATFHQGAWPQVKEQYVDTGKVRFVYRDFPTNEAGAIAAMMARCVPPDRYFGMIEMLYRTQGSWLRSPNPREALRQTARLGGLTGEEFEQCVTNEELFQYIRNQQNAANAEYGVDSTPTFVIGDRKIIGPQSFDVFSDAIEAELSGGGSVESGSSTTPIIVRAVVVVVAAGGFLWWRQRSAKS